MRKQHHLLSAHTLLPTPRSPQDILLAAQQMDSTLERLQVLVEQPDLQLTADPAELTEAGVLTDEEAALESEVEDEERLRRRYHLWQMRRIRLRRSFTYVGLIHFFLCWGVGWAGGWDAGWSWVWRWLSV